MKKKLTVPRVDLKPIMLLKAAGTRPEPAVSVASEKETWLEATDTHEPEEEPPDMWSDENTEAGWPYGDRMPTRPVAQNNEDNEYDFDHNTNLWRVGPI